MKLNYIFFLAVLLHLPLGAQNNTTGEIVETVEIPTEVSEPPYQVGDLVRVQGYYIERGAEEPRINLRIVGNKLRLYWIDESGLIAEPESSRAIVRFIGSVRGDTYHNLTSLPSGAGLGAPGIIRPPHMYTIILTFPNAEGEDPVFYNFRYTQSMNNAADSTADAN